MFKIQQLYLLLLIVFFISPTSLSAQSSKGYQIKGIVKDSALKTPLDGVTAILTKEDGVIVKSAATDTHGVFSFIVADKGNYFISLSSVGYRSFSSRRIDVTTAGVVDLGIIEMVAESGMLGEVVVKSRKALIQVKDDKLVYNASADISNKAGSASDVLRKAPMVSVGADGDVKLRGSSNIKVLLNGMPSGILAKNLKEALKTIPASSIQSIEVITSPSAKYEAEGAAGVINIITKKKIRGTSGNIDLSAGNLDQSANAMLNVAKGKFDFSALVNASSEREREVSELTRRSFVNSAESGFLLQRSDALTKSRGLYGDFSTEYRPDSTQKIGATFSFWNGQWPVQSTLYNLYNSPQGKNEYNQRSNQPGKSQNLDFSLNYQRKFKKPGQELQLIGQYSNSIDKSSYLTDQYDLSGRHYFREQGPNDGKGKDFSAQADYSHPVSKSGKSILETGVRYSQNNSQSAYTVYNNLSNPGSPILTEDPSRSDRMKYYQNVFAAYLSLRIQAKNNWAFRPGVRFENTSLGADFDGQSPSFKAAFTNVVPSMIISKKLNDYHDLKLTYTERIRRPWIWDLNPYVNASDPRNLTYGNPRLRPELTRMFEAGHTYSANSGVTINSAIYSNFNSNAIESLTTVDSLGISRTTSQNIAANKRLGTNVNVYLPLNEDWTLNGGLEFYHVWFKSKALNVQNNGNFYSVSINSSYSLPKNYSLQVSGDYSNGYITLQGRNSADYTYSFSARKELFDNKASITLNVNNPFQKNFLQKSSATAPSFHSQSINRYYNRSFSIAFSWQFGNMRPKPEPETSFPEGEPDDKPMRKPKRH